MKPALRVAAALAAALLGACLPRPQATPRVVHYDFGPQPAPKAPAPIPAHVIVQPPEAPLWIDAAPIHYRLAYDDPAQIRSYAWSRWIGSPMRLLGDLLRRRVAQASPGATGRTAATSSSLPARDTASAPEREPDELVLETHVEEFIQVFDSPKESRGVLRARAVLLRHGGHAVAQQDFTIEEQAPSADAPGAVAALAAASRVLADRITAWVADTAPHIARANAPPPR